MRLCSLLLVLSLVAGSFAAAGAAEPTDVNIGQRLAAMQSLPGFIDMYWDPAEGRLLLAIDEFEAEFLYQSSLARGVGSNDLGLDRGQLGTTRIVQFERSGPKVLLIESNLRYRALGENVDEQQAIRESFARSVIWGFESLGTYREATIIDATDFMLRDAHNIAAHLAQSDEGDYTTDASRSAIYLPRTKGFPDNSEVETVVTFTGTAMGPFLPTVVPDADQFTVHLHHSFIRLPDDDYEPLPYDPRVGLIGLRYGSSGFLDYASAIGEPLQVEYARRHRLQKTNPTAATSDAVEPIVYYVDRGAPEPIRAALLDGARWWSEAFEAAGYRDAYRVEMLPEDADPMDVRYNVIQWVHRSTRGWSYGSSIVDPRTGEILKGHVTLGSLRVRQDYMIAEGLLGPYDGAIETDPMLEMSLARIRQLSAHEVGHTIGIEHNFAASTQDRASVMDYPFPLIRFDNAGNLDLTDAYGTGIGAWDKRVVLYGYQDFPDGADRAAERERIINETIAAGWKYVADQDSRDIGSAHPDGNLWDNGEDAVSELEHLLRVREHALERFGERVIRPGRPLATLEEVLVPIYLLHRYQLQAAGKLIGGKYFSYALRGDGQPPVEPVAPARQRDAIRALLQTLSPSLLRLPDGLLDQLPPRPPGFPGTRETFQADNGMTFDPFGPADSSVALTLEVLLNPLRAARMNAAHARSTDMPGFTELLDALLHATWFAARQAGADSVIQRRANDQVLAQLMRLGNDRTIDGDVQALALDAVLRLDQWLEDRASREKNAVWRAHYGDARVAIRRMQDDPSTVDDIPQLNPPPGAPIGTSLGL